MIIFVLTYLIVGFIAYLITACLLYNVFKQANLKNPWVAFIPGFGTIKTLNLANLSMWWILVLIVVAFIPHIGKPILYIAQFILGYVIAGNFGLKTGYRIIGGLVPVILYLVIITKRCTIQNPLNPNFTNYVEHNNYSETNY